MNELSIAIIVYYFLYIHHIFSTRGNQSTLKPPERRWYAEKNTAAPAGLPACPARPTVQPGCDKVQP
jgi:hypothetical protein